MKTSTSVWMHFGLTLLAVALLTVTASAGSIFERDFSTANPGPFNGESSLKSWTGSSAAPQRGSFKIDTAPVDGSDPAKAALVFISSGVASNSTCATLLNIQTTGFGNGAKTGHCTYRFLIPQAGDGRTILHYGGIWNNNVADIVLQRGGIAVFTQKSQLTVGTYETDKWNDFRIDFDFEKKVFSIFLNDKALGNDLPWNDAKIETADSMTISGNTAAIPPGTPEFYLEKISITSD